MAAAFGLSALSTEQHDSLFAALRDPPLARTTSRADQPLRSQVSFQRVWLQDCSQKSFMSAEPPAKQSPE